jgi:hypothetical protein
MRERPAKSHRPAHEKCGRAGHAQKRGKQRGTKRSDNARLSPPSRERAFRTAPRFASRPMARRRRLRRPKARRARDARAALPGKACERRTVWPTQRRWRTRVALRGNEATGASAKSTLVMAGSVMLSFERARCPTLEITGSRKRAKPAVAGPVHRRVGRRAGLQLWHVADRRRGARGTKKSGAVASPRP